MDTNRSSKVAVSAAVFACGVALAATVPANAQVVLQFGEQQSYDGPSGAQVERRADNIERRGDRRAARAAANGNYERAAQFDRRSGQRADDVRREGAYSGAPEPLFQFRID